MIKHEYCIRCGRRLRNEESQQIGYGPRCLSLMKEEERPIEYPDIRSFNNDEIT